VDDGVVEEISVELREEVLEETIVGVQSSAANLLVVWWGILDKQVNSNNQLYYPKDKLKGNF